MTDRVIITIDGPAGTGKSTVAHRLAHRLGLEFLDTGAMYRAVAMISREEGIEPSDGPALCAMLRHMHMHFEWDDDPPSLWLGDRNISTRIRDLDVSDLVSVVAGQAEIRATLVQQQRSIADRHPRLVTEGRDQGSVVFPDAQVKFYLHARAEERARRRHDQLQRAGKIVDYGEILSEIVNRDELDSTRAVAPLRKPEGAVGVDTSDLTLDQVVNTLEKMVRRHVESSLLTQPAASLGSEGSG